MQSTLIQIVASLRHLRKSQGLTQEYVRDCWHVDISNIENDRNYPGLASYLKICEAYNIGAGWILILADMVDKKQLSSEDMNKILANWGNYREDACFVTEGFLRIVKAKK